MNKNNQPIDTTPPLIVLKDVESRTQVGTFAIGADLYLKRSALRTILIALFDYKPKSVKEETARKQISDCIIGIFINDGEDIGEHEVTIESVNLRES